MNTKLISLMSVLLLAVSGCASTAQNLTTQEGAGEHTLSNVERYHAAVNANAWHKGINVYWVNPPDDDDLAKYSDTSEDNDNGDGTK